MKNRKKTFRIFIWNFFLVFSSAYTNTNSTSISFRVDCSCSTSNAFTPLPQVGKHWTLASKCRQKFRDRRIKKKIIKIWWNNVDISPFLLQTLQSIIIINYQNVFLGVSKLGMAQWSVQRRFGIVTQTKLFQFGVRVQGQGWQMQQVMGARQRRHGQRGNVHHDLPTKTHAVRHENRQDGEFRKPPSPFFLASSSTSLYSHQCHI